MVVYIVVNYSSDVFHNEVVVTVYSYLMGIFFLIHTILFLLIILIIITRSKKIGCYKWYILNGVIWSYTVEALMALWQPVPLFPVFMAYSKGIIGPYLNYDSEMIMFIIFIIIYINVIINLIFSFLVRFANSAPSSEGKIFMVRFFTKLIEFMIEKGRLAEGTSLKL